MKSRVACLGLGLLQFVPLGVAAEKKAAPFYSNQDLERVAPLRAETGATSTPAVLPAVSFVDDSAARKRQEAHWRHEAERHQARLSALRRRADDLRLRLEVVRQKAEEQRRSAQGRGRSGARGSISEGPVQSAEARLRAVEDQMRELDSAFEERARRAGALPGWIR